MLASSPLPSLRKMIWLCNPCLLGVRKVGKPWIALGIVVGAFWPKRCLVHAQDSNIPSRYWV